MGQCLDVKTEVFWESSLLHGLDELDMKKSSGLEAKGSRAEALRGWSRAASAAHGRSGSCPLPTGTDNNEAQEAFHRLSLPARGHCIINCVVLMFIISERNLCVRVARSAGDELAVLSCYYIKVKCLFEFTALAVATASGFV